MLYVVGGRSFASKNPGRKISEVVSVWKKLGIDLSVQYGRDLIVTADSKEEYGNQSFYNASYRKNKNLSFLVHSISELRDLRHDAAMYKKLSHDYGSEKLDIIWERSSRLHWAGLKLAQKKKIPFVLEWKDHLVDYKSSFLKWYALSVEKKKIREADYIVVESTVLKHDLMKEGVSENKIRVALNAVNPVEFKRDLAKGEAIKDKLGIPKGNTVVGYLGSYAFYHNAEILIQAADIILKKESKTSFLLVGNGKDYLKCKEMAQNAGLFEKGLLMLDGVPKEDVPFLLSAMDITVLPGSTDIICPIKIMEYMAAETAVVAPNYECNREVMTHDQNGLLFEPGSANDLAAKIQALINNGPLRLELSKNARNFVSETLVWEQTWGKVLLDILAEQK